MTTPTPTDRQLLEFEARFYRHYGAKVAAIRDELDLSDVAYWQRIVQIIAAPADDLAVDHGPTISRLRRVLAARLNQKVAAA